MHGDLSKVKLEPLVLLRCLKRDWLFVFFRYRTQKQN